MDFSPIAKRGFTNWSMAYVGQNTRALQEFEAIAEMTQFEPEKISGYRIYEVLQEQLAKADKLSVHKAA